MIQFRKLSHTI